MVLAPQEEGSPRAARFCSTRANGHRAIDGSRHGLWHILDDAVPPGCRGSFLKAALHYHCRRWLGHEKTAGPIDIDCFGQRTPGWLAFSGRFGKAGVEIGFERAVHKERRLLGAGDPCQPELLDQPILQSIKQPLHTSLGLRRECKDRLYTESQKRLSHLSGRLLPGQLLLHGPVIVVTTEDPMAIPCTWPRECRSRARSV